MYNSDNFNITKALETCKVIVDLSLLKSYISIALKLRKKRSNMFGSIGFPELLIIMTIALLIFGPKKLPEVGRSIGKALREFRKTSDEIKEKIEDEIQAEEFREIKKDIKEITDFKSITTPKEDSPSGKPDFTQEDPYKTPQEESSQEEETTKEKDGNKDGKKVSG